MSKFRIEISGDTAYETVTWKVEAEEYGVNNVEECVQDIVHRILEPKKSCRPHEISPLAARFMNQVEPREQGKNDG